MKFSSYVYYQQNDLKLVRGLKAKFGDNAILIFGDWSVPNTKYQEPTWNKRLKKTGFIVYLTDEYKTSTFCPTCEDAQTRPVFRTKQANLHKEFGIVTKLPL
ncbi:hypothetical protein G6F56_013967 [Rhizopus delemar]|nr:hypothetical protein G6F56_013967 [Rhizopus delemar]